MIRLQPHAKINLGLLIKGRRADGYHLLETLLYPLPKLKDELTLTKSDKLGLELKGIELDADWQDNLCIKAYRILQREAGELPPVHIVLTKHIPAGAGLGGGSSDAAFTMRGLNTLFELGLSQERLAELGAELGADVPFFIYDQPMMARGIGTDLSPFELDLPYEIKLVRSSIHSSTVAAYKALDYRMFDPERSLSSMLEMDAKDWRAQLPNDLETPVFGLYPKLAESKAQLYEEGAIYAAMSGSGSAVFGLFEKE